MTVLSRSVMGCCPSTKRGPLRSVRFEGREIGGADAEEMRACGARRSRWCSRSRLTSLKPRHEDRPPDHRTPALYPYDITKKYARELALSLLSSVGIPSPSGARPVPAEMSGGMPRGYDLAIAFACGPKLLLADEPTTAST